MNRAWCISIGVVVTLVLLACASREKVGTVDNQHFTATIEYVPSIVTDNSAFWINYEARSGSIWGDSELLHVIGPDRGYVSLSEDDDLLFASFWFKTADCDLCQFLTRLGDGPSGYRWGPYRPWKAINTTDDISDQGVSLSINRVEEYDSVFDTQLYRPGCRVHLYILGARSVEVESFEGGVVTLAITWIRESEVKRIQYSVYDHLPSFFGVNDVQVPGLPGD